MPEITYRVATAADAPALAEAANAYTFQNLAEPARRGGFLTGSFTPAALQAMLASVPGQVAYADGQLAGFIINSRLAPERYPPLVQHIARLLPDLIYRQVPLAQYRWFFYGPVLVPTAFRGQGVLPQLFAANKQALQAQYDLGIAFIAAQNAASLHVHTAKLGLEVVETITFEGVDYALLVFPLAGG